MDYSNNPDRLLLIQQFNRVSTLAQVEAALTALRGWRKLHPDDRGILDAGEELSLIYDALLEDDSPGKPASWSEWQWLEYQVMGARTLPDIKDARYALKQWTKHHPNETEPDLLEMLFLLLDVVEGQVTGKEVRQVQPRELAGRVV